MSEAKTERPRYILAPTGNNKGTLQYFKSVVMKNKINPLFKKSVDVLLFIVRS